MGRVRPEDTLPGMVQQKDEEEEEGTSGDLRYTNALPVTFNTSSEINSAVSLF